MQIYFHNLEESELAKEIVEERVGKVMRKFPVLDNHQIRITLSMENSPTNPGPQSFTVKLHINGSRFRDMIIKKSAPNLYSALALVTDVILVRIQRKTPKSTHLRSLTRESHRRSAV